MQKLYLFLLLLMNANIANLSTEQNQLTEEINENVAIINTVAQGIVSGSETISYSGHEVEQLINEMNLLVGKFTLS